jgi:hypothetical protein
VASRWSRVIAIIRYTARGKAAGTVMFGAMWF